MIIIYKIFPTIPGASVVRSAALRIVKPLKVRVETIEYDIIYSPAVPVGRQVAYRSLIGALIFPVDLIFDGTQRVYCLYKLG